MEQPKSAASAFLEPTRDNRICISVWEQEYRTKETRNLVLEEMDTLGIEPRAFRMQSGCDTTTPCAQVQVQLQTRLDIYGGVRAGSAIISIKRVWQAWGLARLASRSLRNQLLKICMTSAVSMALWPNG